MHRHLHLPNSQQKDSKASPYAPYKNPFPSRPAGSPIGTPQTGARHDSQRDYAGDQQQGSSQSRHTSQNHSRAPQQSGASAWGNGGAGGSQGFRTVAMPSTEGENERMSGGWGAPRPRKDFLETERQRASAVLAEERAEQAKTSQKDLDTKEATVRKQQLEQKKEKREREERKKAALAKKAAAPPAAPASASTSSIYGRLPSKLPAVRAAGDAAYRRQQEELKSSWERGATGCATKKDSKGKGRAKPVTILSDSDVDSPKPSPVKRSGSNLAKKAAKRAKSSTVMVDIESSPDPQSHKLSKSSKPCTSSKPSTSSKTSGTSSSKKVAKELNPAAVELDDLESVQAPVNLDALIADKLREDRAERRAKHALRNPKKKGGVFTDDSDSDFDSEMDDGEFSTRDATPDVLLLDEDDRPDPSTLCPFCSHPLPAHLSERLSSLKAHLLAQPHAKPAPTSRNPFAMYLPIVEIRSFCRRHKEETVTIPAGEARGWPTEIDWKGLPRRIDRQVGVHLQNVISGSFVSPFLVAAKEEWESKGARKMGNVMSEWGTFDLEQPGYYGLRGSELMNHTLTKLYITDSSLLTPLDAQPLDLKAYVRRVLVPECAVELIQSDLSISRDEALRVRGESCAYGKARFAMTEEEEEFQREEEARGEMEVREREEKVRRWRRRERERREEEERDEEGVRERARRMKKASGEEPTKPTTALRKPKRQIERERAREEQQLSSSAVAAPDDWRKNLGDRSSEEDVMDVDVDEEDEILDVEEPEPKLKEKKKKAAVIDIDSD